VCAEKATLNAGRKATSIGESRGGVREGERGEKGQ
jgi:hypothetical protein